MTRIQIFQTTQFTKTGKLKKNAKTEYITEVENYDAFKMADYIKYLGYTDFETPYFFTHIKAKSPYGGEVRIFQDCMIGGQWLITSPQKLITGLA